LDGGGFAKWKIVIDDNAAKEILTEKGQCKNGFCQRANALTVTIYERHIVA